MFRLLLPLHQKRVYNMKDRQFIKTFASIFNAEFAHNDNDDNNDDDNDDDDEEEEEDIEEEENDDDNFR